MTRAAVSKLGSTAVKMHGNDVQHHGMGAGRGNGAQGIGCGGWRMGTGGWGMGLHFRSWLREPGQQTGENAAEVVQPRAVSVLTKRSQVSWA